MIVTVMLVVAEVVVEILGIHVAVVVVVEAVVVVGRGGGGEEKHNSI